MRKKIALCVALLMFVGALLCMAGPAREVEQASPADVFLASITGSSPVLTESWKSAFAADLTAAAAGSFVQARSFELAAMVLGPGVLPQDPQQAAQLVFQIAYETERLVREGLPGPEVRATMRDRVQAYLQGTESGIRRRPNAEREMAENAGSMGRSNAITHPAGEGKPGTPGSGSPGR